MTAFSVRRISALMLTVATLLAGTLLYRPVLAAIPGCETSTFSSYSAGFSSDDFDLNNVAVDGDGYFFLETGNQAINPQSIVIPFEQEVWVSFFYEDAGYRSTLGWMLKNDAVNSSGAFLGWNNIPLAKKHPLFRRIADGSGGGNGILDIVAGLNESALASYDDGTPYKFVIDGDGTLTPRDMKKSLGTFAAGTELVFFLGSDQDYTSTTSNRFFFTQNDWNPDVYTQCTPPSGDARWTDQAAGTFYRTYQLGNPSGGNDCTLSKGLLDANAIARLSTNFGLTLAGNYDLTVTQNAKFSHVIVAAPQQDPNQWILSWEDLSGGGDMDYNDTTFRIERKTGGTAQLKNSQAIIPTEAEAYYTAVTLEVYDYIPGGSCAGSTKIIYALSIDNGTTWVEVTNWDTIKNFSFDGSNNKVIGTAVNGWTPGSPEYTYRVARIDFSELGLSGRELLWKATLISNNEACVPKVIASAIEGSVATHAFFSRSSPVMAANVLYTGSFETPAIAWNEKRPRGHIQATRLYDPTDPSLTDTLAIWDAGTVLASRSPATRTIYFPDVTHTQVTGEVLTLVRPDDSEITAGDGITTTFSGTLAHAPILATTLVISAAGKSFHDEHTDVLRSDWGSGTINRFTGEFEITFDSAPADGIPITAGYIYYTAASTPQAFTTSNTRVTNGLLGLDATYVIPTGYRYDLDSDGDYDEADGDWLVEWVRGYADGTSRSTQKEWKLGPIDHSVPALLSAPGRPMWYYGTDTTGADRESYDLFKQAHADRDSVLFVGARDGMIHAFDAGKFRWGNNPMTPETEQRGYFLWDDSNGDGTPAPNYGTGNELWSFIPANLLSKLKNNLMRGEDQAYVDASPALADVSIDGDWRSVLLVAEGNGGDTVFCLDVTIPDHPAFMWEFADPDLFRSRSSPAVGQIGRIMIDGNARWAAFFVSGKTYDATQYPSIYLIDITDGSVIERIVLDSDPAGIGGVPSGQPAIVDSDGNGYIDRLYIGTDKGRMYKVNLSDDPDAQWHDINSCVINTDFVDDDGSVDVFGNPVALTIPEAQRWHPIYASPTVIVDNGVTADGRIDFNIRVFFGTGDSPYYDEGIDTANTNYHFFAYTDKNGKGECASDAVELDWFYTLPAGARIFASAFAAAGQIYFGTATSETENPCDGTNQGKLYVFNTTGYALEHPAEPTTVKETGDITTSPTVEDEHLFVKSSNGTILMGGGKYNNTPSSGGLGNAAVTSWKEIYE